MSTDYDIGVYLDQVPIGFGTYTGISLFNKSDKSIKYYAEMSKTSLYKGASNDVLPDTDVIDDNLYDTLFVTNDLNNLILDDNKVNLTLAAGESGLIYVAHKPFATFLPGYESTGIENAILNITSQSSAGDVDSLINIKVTGQRVIDSPVPTKPGRFFAIESYDELNKYSLDFNWQLIGGNAFVSKFKIDLCSDDDFSQAVADSPYEIPVVQNSESWKPDYLDYYNYGSRNFSHKISNLPIDSYIYARISAINLDDQASDYTYSTGFKLNTPYFINDVTYKGLHPSPGDNLGFGTEFLTINKGIDQEYEIDLAEILYEANNNSYDFTAYTGVVLNFYSNSNVPDSNSKIGSQTKSVAAIRLKRPEGENFTYSVNASNKFNLVLNFENISVVGYNGKGAEWNGDTVVDAENGGPIFDLDNLNYGAKIFDYYINKDKDSIFYAGLGGTDAFKRNIKNNPAILVDGEENDLNEDDLSNFDEIPYLSSEPRIEVQGRGSDGKLISTSESSGSAGNLPSVYLGFSERNSTSFLPESTFLFRFKTEGISDSAGTSKSTWSSSAGKAIELKNKNNESVLTVREAYGRKFYELTGAENQAKAIEAFNKNTNNHPYFGSFSNAVDLRPNYTILVFALARKELIDGDFYGTISYMLNKCNAIHKFVDDTPWGSSTQTDSKLFWGVEYAPFNPNNLIYNFHKPLNKEAKASFVGSSLNSPAFVQPGTYQERSNSTKYDTRERGFFIYSNQMSPSFGTWRDTLTIKPDDGNTRKVASHFPFKDFNLAKTSNFLADDNEKFMLSDSTELAAFELFFVKMHSTITDYNATITSDFGGAISGLRNETFINGVKVFDHLLALQPKKDVQKMLIQLNNNDPNTDEDDNTKTRLYLFDYIYGAADDEKGRNQASDSIMEYLASYYSPLIMKSSSGKLQVAKHDSGTNNQLSFGLPLSHNFLNLYSN